MSLTPQFLDELRARTTLSALIGKSVKLQRAGNEFKACCPFHNEKSPSFYVNDDKGFYHCFGCSAHGDAIKWMTDQRGLPFIDAVKELVAAAGMEMPAQDQRSAERAEKAKGLHEAMADADRWFAEQLASAEGTHARAALDKRGIRPDTARSFGMGFAPDTRGRLKAALATYGDAMLVEAGMLIQVDGKDPYDRFRGRLMIPIRDVRGRTIAFGGRILGDGEPKYLNSPETPLFDKGRTLYNLDRAQAAARKAGRVIAVEGYMDVIALAQAGFAEVVAPLGTALTEHQLERLWRLSDVPILCFDGDAAGIKAARRAAERALPLLSPGKSMSIVTIPNGKDPDDIVRIEGPRAFEELLAQKESLSEFLWRVERDSLSGDPGPDERAAFEHEMARLAGTIEHIGIKREYFRTFKDRFFALFGSKERRLRLVAQDMVAASTISGPIDLIYAYQKAILLGLMRYPEVLLKQCEIIAKIHILDGILRHWRDHLLELAFFRNDLNENMLEEVLSADPKLSPIILREYSRDLAFSFWWKGGGPDAEIDLVRAITTLVDERELTRAENAANEHCKRDTTEENFRVQQHVLAEREGKLSDLRAWLESMEEAA